MNEENNNEIQAPDFEGEEMKMPENASQPTEETESSLVSGPILAVLALILVLILGGMYYWFASLNTWEPLEPPAPTERPTPEDNNEPESTTAEAQTDALEVVSTSDELSAIEADVEATNLDSLDSELQAIDAELEAALEEI
jgi:hypothetical protein